MTAMIDYNAGNVFSVSAAFRRLGEEVVLTSDRETILSADRVVFPGVGYASAAMDEIAKRNLSEVISLVEKPFLGICLGMQLLCRSSQEGDVDMLGVIDAPVLRFDPQQCRKIPQIGWNRVYAHPDSQLFDGIGQGSWFFFDHSYYVPLLDEGTEARTEYYGFWYSSAITRGNFHGVQFHPEKSGKAGERLLANFLSLEA